MSGVTLKQVTAFLAVAEAGSFTLAAERIRIAQPALSQSIRELESELGLRLFDRTTRRVELTDAGREFREATARVVDDLDFAIRNARDLASRKRGRIVVAAPPLLAANVLPWAIRDFTQEYPDIEIALIDGPTRSIADTVRSGGADCGVGTFLAGEDGLAREPLMRDRLQVICRSDNPIARSTSVRWVELATQPIVALTRESGIRRLMDIGFEAAEIQLAPAYEVNQIATVLGMVQAGFGVAVLPTYARAGMLSMKLVSRPMSDPDIGRDIVLIHARGRSISPAVSAFTPVLRQALRRLTPRDPVG